MKESEINQLIKQEGVDTNLISDGYHTFGELYEHRITLFIALCKALSNISNYPVWRSFSHHDGSAFKGWFIMGMEFEPGKQISYHLPHNKWDECEFAQTLEKAPEWDGHTSNDVLERLKSL